jgi:hypothetical protein
LDPVSIISPSPSVSRIATSADESHPLNSVAPVATILNYVLTPASGGFSQASLSRCINAVQETYQPAFIVIQ